MDADQIRHLKPRLIRYLGEFDDCFSRREAREHFATYVEGQLSDLGEKSCEPIAVAAGVPPRNLQEFLAAYKWDEDRARNRLQEMVVRDDAGHNAVGIIDETSDVKQGDKTPGVQRQWCGTAGKTENCIVTVHLGYATGDFHCLLDGDLFLPESWSEDRDRCREAGIPDDVVYRPKWKIALELLDRAHGNGVVFDWMTFDEGYGGKPEFLRELTAREQMFVGEVPKTCTGWIRPPRVTQRPFRRGRGRAQDATSVLQQPAGDQRGKHAEVLARIAGPTVGALSCQGRRKGTDGVGGQAHQDHRQGRPRVAGRASALGGGPQHPEPGRDQILLEQRPGGNLRANPVAGGLLALARRAVF